MGSSLTQGAGLGGGAFVAISQFIPGWDVVFDAALITVAIVAVANVSSDSAQNAATDAQTDLKDSPQDQTCAKCGEVGCFNVPPGGDPNEFERQLKEQENTINNTKPSDLVDRVNKFQNDGRPNDSAARQKARNNAKTEAYNEAYEDALNNGATDQAAQASGNKAAADAVDGMDATHGLDWVAGGDGSIPGMGDSSTNRSIGSQWTKAAPGKSTTRVQDLKAAAEAAAKAGKKLDVKLKKC